MCGIVGVVGAEPAAPVLLAALQRLEYRGYDSAGIATLMEGRIVRRRAAGKLAALEALLARDPLPGTLGIGHTRWATHGAPSEGNAHPHATARVAVVHNGIIENHAALRAELETAGQVFATGTDTETVAQLLDLLLRQGLSPEQAVAAALPRLHGAYALALIFAGYPRLMIGARHGAPLAVGFGAGEAMYLGSDALALAPLTRRIAYLEDGDWAVLRPGGVSVRDPSGREAARRVQDTAEGGAAVGRDGYRHFMEKELHEHPAVIARVLGRLLTPAGDVALPPLPFDLAAVPRVTISACGSAFYAGALGRLWCEALARLPADVEVASEFRYRDPPLPPGGLGVLVSQSGETADTLAALRTLRAQGQHVLSVVNVAESSMARASDVVLDTVAGPEIGVASTKAFTAQLTVLACLAIAAARAREALGVDETRRLAGALLALPAQASALLADPAPIRRVAGRLVGARDVLYLGRGPCYPIALEGALKLKEISYIHAEGYAAGEMKHGPIALIDASVPVIALAPSGPLFDKTASNLAEAAARGGQVIVFSDRAGAARLGGVAADAVVLPDCDPFTAPILHAIAVQLLAYHVARLKGTDVDQPRNLAKSVTVE